MKRTQTAFRQIDFVELPYDHYQTRLLAQAADAAQFIAKGPLQEWVPVSKSFTNTTGR